jgi:Leucine-rich repeat (LRR) protein
MKKKMKRILPVLVSAVLAVSGAGISNTAFADEEDSGDNEEKTEYSFDYFVGDGSVFASYLFNNFDTNNDDVLSKAEIEAVTEIDISHGGNGAYYNLGANYDDGLYEDYDELTSLKGIEVFTNLEVLNCSYNDIYTLDLSSNTKLRELDCSSNYMYTLNVSGCTALESLKCSGNAFTKLDLSNNSKLNYLKCFNNEFTSLNLQGCPELDSDSVFAGSDVGITYYGSDTVVYPSTDILAVINEENFPDSTFRAKVKSYDEDGDGALSQQEVMGVSAMYLTQTATDDDYDDDEIYAKNYTKITSLKGIEYFRDLEILNCEGHALTSLDLSKNKLLKVVRCSDNQLSELNLGNNTNLISIICVSNNLQALDISGVPNLLYLNCIDNQLTQLDLRTSTKLKEAYCSENSITQIDVSKNNNLKRINCDDNPLKKIILTTKTDKSIFDYNAYPTDFFTDDSIEKSYVYFITEEVFPDAAFRQYVSDNLDTDKDGTLTEEERKQCTEIDVNGLGIESLKGIEAFSSVEVLDCGNNSLTDLDLSSNVALTRLTCSSNKLTSLELSACRKLTYLDCRDNQLSRIVVNANTEIEILSDSTEENEITIEYVTEVPATADVFPDNNFRSFISYEIDTNGDGILSTKEIEACKELIVDTDYYVKDLTGIEVFKNLESLDCADNKLTTLDLSQNKALKTLDCSRNSLTKLVLGDNQVLTSVSCSSNKLTELDLSQNVALEQIDCKENNLTELDLSNNANLVSLDCSSNELSSLDVSANDKLESLYCDKNQITSLDVSANSLLERLSCKENQLTSLDLSENKYILYIYCDKNQLTDLTLADKPHNKIKKLKCTGNQLEELDLKDNEVWELYCSDNKISKLDISNQTFLQYLECENNGMKELLLPQSYLLKSLKISNNELTTLDLSTISSLEYLYCNNNKLTTLDVRGLKVLECANNNLSSLTFTNSYDLLSVDCSNNALTKLDVSNNVTMGKLVCANNKLTDLKLATSDNLMVLDCSNNKLASLDVSIVREMGTLNCSNNALTSLDLSENFELSKLDCSGNKLTSLDLTNVPMEKKDVKVDSSVEVKYSALIYLPAPTLASVSNTVTGVKVTWKAVDGATGYIVYRKAAGGSWAKVKTLANSGILSYVDTSVAKKSGSTYVYTVEAYNKPAEGNTVYSGYDAKGLSIRRLAQVSLQEPVNTAKGVTVKWSKVAGASGYVVYRKAGTAKTWTKLATVAGNTKVSYLDAKAKTNGTKYTYTVKAYYGSTLSTADQTGKTIYYVSATGISSFKNSAGKKAAVKWSKNAKATGYQIQYSTSAKFASSKTVTVKGAASVTTTLSKLTKGKTYYVRVRAYKKGTSANYFSVWSSAKKVKISK